MSYVKKLVVAGAAVLATCGVAAAQQSPRANSCNQLNSYAPRLQGALQNAVANQYTGNPPQPTPPPGVVYNGGFGLNMWATLVANDGTVCAVVYSGGPTGGNNYQKQWLASRVISAQKASTANGLSLSNGGPPTTAATGGQGFALSTANLYAAVQGGGPLYGLQFSNPVDPEVAYDTATGQPDNPATFGTPNDPMIGRPIGGVNVFGGGLALYVGGQKVGGLGVSGDTSCTDHYVAWEVRNALQLDGFASVVLGPGSLPNTNGDAQHPDNIIFDVAPTPGGSSSIQGNVGVSTGGWGHPGCAGRKQSAPSTLPVVN